jgi:ABC-type multidrug transport system ATPase subunit
MRILGGLDAHYSGFVGYNIETGNSRRLVGWCSQSDPLFEFLTVREHLRLFFDLIGNQQSQLQIDDQICSMLLRLDLLGHADKDIQLLSGGMKRRLSLLLACLGDPYVLLLDEPTSGCDSYTRELVRKDILARKDLSAVLISTHHIDDVEIISDQVWFLNEHNLIYNGSLSQLHENKCERAESYQSGPFSLDQTPTSLEFTTCSSEIKRLFLEAFPNLPKNSYSLENSLFSCLVPVDTPQNISRLHQFLAQLETQHSCQWSLISPNAYKSLSRMYDITERTYSRDLSENHHTENSFFLSWVGDTILIKRILTLITLRMNEIKSQHSQFVISQLIFPFVIVLLLVFACSDVRFPKLELRSSSIGGIGEVLVSNGANREPIDLDLPLDILSRSLWSNSSETREDFRFQSLQDILGESLSWRGSRSSEELFVDLYSEYFDHNEKNRWVSFVLDDTVQNWLQSRVRITKNALKLSLPEILTTLSQLQSSICKNQSNENALSNGSWHLQFCTNGTSNIEISVVNQTLSHVHSINASNSTDSSGTIMVTVYQSLHSNLTMMTNITTDHGSPIFLKEIVPYIFGLGNSLNNSIPLNFSMSRSYTLFSHPFDDATDSSSMYVQRGYLGALMIILYLLLISSVSVRFITNNKNSGTKTQLHLCGVSPIIYWVSNFLVDSVLLFSTFFCVYTAIWIGGPPIRNFFFSDEPESGRSPGFLFFLTLSAYSCSSVSGNYLSAVLSKDQIASQLFSLITTICSGLFLKFFISLQGPRPPYPLISALLTCLFPSYAFSSCLFEMFTRYVKQLGKSVGILDVGFQLNWNDVYFPIVVMYLQTIVYLFMTVLVDFYWYRLICNLEKLSKSSSFLQWIEKFSTETRNRLRSISDLTLRRSLDHYLQVVSLTSLPDELEAVVEEKSEFMEQQNPYLSPTLGKGIERALSQLPHLNESAKNQSVDLLNLTDLSIRYQHSSTNVLKELNLKLQCGERIALMGINGGGKSSLFKTLSTDEMIPVTGNASICADDIVRNYWKLCEIGTVGYVPQDGGLLEYLTVKDAIDLFLGLRGRLQLPLAHLQSIFSILPKKYLSYSINSLSGGNKKKLSVVLSNITLPSLLLLDEPTSGVDPAAAERIVQYLSGISTNQGIIFASHRLDECLRICRRVFMLYSGRIQFDGKMSLFDSISDLFYQVDIGLIVNNSRSNNVDTFLQILVDLIRRSTPTPDESDLFERVVVYNDSLIRITCEKYLVPLSIIWKVLQELDSIKMIAKYSFRRMDMEEIFAILQAGTNSEQK